MPTAANDLARFLPAFLRQRSVNHAAKPLGDEQWSLRGALLFVDIVDFTRQVDRLMARGPQGVELANELLNDTIGALVAELVASGGDVAVFAGDALFVLWPAFDDEADMAPAIARAARGALGALERATENADPQRPQLRFSLGAGSFTAHRVGGHAGRWHVLLSGPAFEQVGRADALAINNALLASPEAQALAAGCLQGETMEQGLMRVRAALVNARRAPTDPGPVSTADLEAHVPEAVLNRSRSSSRQALAEFRNPSVIFARLPDLLSEGQLDGARARQACRILQTIVAELDGSELQFVIDDKGPVFIVAFGLSTRVHEDDPVRAAMAALRIVNELSAQGIACGVGVATGRVFCGLIGAVQRCNYTLIGRTMNLAARLMQHAAPGPLFDASTHELSRSRIDFADEGEVQVKGLDLPVLHYRALTVREATKLEMERDSDAGLVGRVRELDVLRTQVDALERERRGAVVAVVGEAGIGKTRLVRALMSAAGEASITCLVAAAGTIEAAPHARWRPALNALLALRRDKRATDEDRLALDPYLLSFLGQSREVIPDTDDEERAYRTREAIARLVIDTSRHVPLLLCVEDTHWMDSLSWSVVTRLARATAETGPCLLLLLTSRDLDTQAPPDALSRLTRAGLLRLSLGPLAMSERAQVAQDAVGARAMTTAAAEWIGRHSGGNPLFCRELAVAAVESGQLHIVDGVVEATSRDTPGGARLPDTLQGLIASRLDRLEPAEQNSLRMAAVIGPRFSTEALLALQPSDELSLRRALQRLRERGLLDADPSAAEDHYAFHHALVCDSAYDSLPYRRRRELHANLATWLETRFSTDLAPQAASLAYHWERAENWERAFTARLAAGDAALQNYANREAADHFSAAVVLRGKVPALQTHAQAWHAELGLARAEHRMGDERSSRAHIDDALRATGENLPTHRGTLVLGILRELLLRALPARLRPQPETQRCGTLRATVQAFDTLPEILYYDNDPLALTHAVLRFLRLAEAEAYPSAEHARALAWFALLQASFGSRHSLDRRLDHALVLAESANDMQVDAWIRLARGSTMAQLGDWSAAEQWLADARVRCAAMGDRTRWWNVTSGLGHVLSYRGELAAGAALLNEALNINRDTDNPLFLCWGLSGHAEILHRLGRPEERGEVVRRLRTARDALAQRPDAAADLFSRGVLAAALWRDDHHDEAFTLARSTIDQTLDRAPLVWLQVSSYLGLAEVLSEAGHDPALRAEALRLFARLEHSLRGFARLIPVGRAAHHLVCGQIALLLSRPELARKHLLSGLQCAQQLGQPLEAGKLHLSLADALGPQRPREQVEQLERSAAIFGRIHAHYAHTQVRMRLDEARAQGLALRS